MVEGQQHEVLTRPQFELYEKSVNVAIHRAEREITDPEERTALNNFTKVVRDLVEAKRDLVETAAVMVEHAELRRQGVDVDGAYNRYDEAVAQHSEDAVKDGNALLLNMNRAHAAWSEAGHPESLDHPAAWIYYKEMTSVVEAARGGNGYLQDVVERSETLRIVAEEMQERQREAGGSENATSQASGAGDQGEIDAVGLKHTAEDREEQRLAAEAQSVHEQHGWVDALHRAADQVRDAQAGDANRQSTGPAQQQVTRQDLQRQERANDRDDDDYDR